MTTETLTRTETAQDAMAEKIRQLREIYADAPEIGRAGLEQIIAGFAGGGYPQQKTTSAGRTGLRQGKVSELTAIWKFAPGGAKRMRALLSALGGDFHGAEKVGTVHDMRFVFLENDTKMLFATAYDGDWDPYIDDFATKIPAEMDVLFSNMEGWPGIRDPAVKDWIAASQLTADAWYVANPNLTVGETRRLEKVGKAVDELLDQIG